MKAEVGSRFNSVTRTYTSSGSSARVGSGFTPTSSSVLSLRDKYNSLSRSSTGSASTSSTSRTSSDTYSRSYSSYKPYGSTSTHSDSTTSRSSSYTPYKSYSSSTSDASSKSVYTPWSKSYRSTAPEKTSSYSRPSYTSKPDADTRQERTSTYRSSLPSKLDSDSKSSYAVSSSDLDSRSSYSRFKSDTDAKPSRGGIESSQNSWKPTAESKSSYYSSKKETDTSSSKDSLNVYSRYGHYGTRKSPVRAEVDNLNDGEKINVTTRHTSPTPPSNSSYLRNRRAALESIYQCDIQKRPFVSKTDCQTQTVENDIYAALPSISSDGEDSDSIKQPCIVVLSPINVTNIKCETGSKNTEIINPSKIGGFSYVRPADIQSRILMNSNSLLPVCSEFTSVEKEPTVSPSTFHIPCSDQNSLNYHDQPMVPMPDFSLTEAPISGCRDELTTSPTNQFSVQPSPCKSPSPVKSISSEESLTPDAGFDSNQHRYDPSTAKTSSSSPSREIEAHLCIPGSPKASSPANSSSPNIFTSRSRSPTTSYSFTISPRNHRSRSKESISNQNMELNVTQTEHSDESPSYHLTVPSAFQINLETRRSGSPNPPSRSPSPSFTRARSPFQDYTYDHNNSSQFGEQQLQQPFVQSTSTIFTKLDEIKPAASFDFKPPIRSPDKSFDSDHTRSDALIPKIHVEPSSYDNERHFQESANTSASDGSSEEKRVLASRSDSLSFNGPKSSTTQSHTSRDERADKPPVHPASPNVGVRVSSKERMESLRYTLMRSETPVMPLKSKSFDSSSEDISDLTFDFSGKHYVINEFTENHTNIPNARKIFYEYGANDASPKVEDSSSHLNGTVQSQEAYRIRKFDSGERDWWTQEDAKSGSPRDVSTEFLREDSRTKSETHESSQELSFQEARSKSPTPERPSEQYHIRKFDSGERDWWLEDAARTENKVITVSQEEIVEKKQEETDFWAELAAENEKHELEMQHAYRLRNMDVDSSSWWIEKETAHEDADSQSLSVENSYFKSPTEQEEGTGSSVFYEDEVVNVNQERNEGVAYTYAIRKFDSGETPWVTESPYEQENDELLDRKHESDSFQDQNHESGVWSMDTYDSISTPQRSTEQFLIKTVSGHTLWYASDKSEPPVEFPEDERPFRIGEGEKMCWVDDNTISQSYSESAAERPWFAEKDVPEDQIQRGYEIKKTNSGEKPWWLDDEEKTDTGFDDTLCSPLRCTESQSENNLTRTDFTQADLSSKGSDAEDELESASQAARRRSQNPSLFICELTNIDELLGEELSYVVGQVEEQEPTSNQEFWPTLEDEDEDKLEEVTADQVKIHDNTPQTYVIEPSRGIIKLDDSALQLYKDGDYSSYLDLDSTISEQQEEFEGFQANRKNSIVLRTQLSVRVHTIIEKLLNSEGSELRRALFCLKQIFQEDKDLVHEFVQNDGLSCLIKVGSDANQNYQNYILRALGQVMLYVDGMNGVIEHNETIQWLYCLVSSKFRLVVKTALKLLLVFVEYVESNCLLLIQAINTVDKSRGTLPWSNIMKLLNEYDVTDTELLIYAMTLINKTLNRVPDLDTYYDQVDEIEKQGIQDIVRRYMSRPGTDLDFLHQLQTYEAVLNNEDGGDKSTPLKQLDDNIRTTRHRNSSMINDLERRRSRRNSTGTVPLTLSLTPFNKTTEDYILKQAADDGVGVTPALRRRLERGDRQKLLVPQEEIICKSPAENYSSDDGGMKNGLIKSDFSNGDLKYYNGEADSCLPRENTVKDLTQKLATLSSPSEESPTKLTPSRVGEMKGIISKAIEGLAKSQSKSELKSPTSESPPIRIPEVKKSETELHWEELLASTTRALQLCDLDFTDLCSDDEKNILAPTSVANGIPPPPPPCAMPPPAPMAPSQSVSKTKKTVKLFWKEVCEDPIVMAKMNSSLIWDELSPVPVDTQKLEHLFESRTKDLITKKQHELNKNKEIIVLDPKRSNAINIGMTKLPPPRAIKTAILKMDATVMNREGLEKLLTMLPSEEERSKIQEAQTANPDLPLGSAEQFLLTLASITELAARLKLWAFKLDYENSEKEIADPLMDLKQGMELLKTNKTFRAILATLLSIGIFLNGNEVKGFQIEYLAKVPEVKDTVHKHSLLHHLCHMVMSKFPQSTDLYSEIGAVTRASKVDFDELSLSIQRMEQECKASFDHLKVIVKHDGTTAMKGKMSDFLADCAERIIVLCKVHRRVINRYHRFCLWLGIPLHRVQLTKPNELCRIISEFALEYRTTRERVLQQLEKKANHRERNKTRGKMITEIGKVHTTKDVKDTKEDRADAELRQLLGDEHIDRPHSASPLHGSLPWRRQKKDFSGKGSPYANRNGHHTDGDDELLETLVKTATKIPTSRAAPRERKRIRNADRKSFRHRTLRNGLSEEDKKYLSSYIKSY